MKLNIYRSGYFLGKKKKIIINPIDQIYCRSDFSFVLFSSFMVIFLFLQKYSYLVYYIVLLLVAIGLLLSRYQGHRATSLSVLNDSLKWNKNFALGFYSQ